MRAHLEVPVLDDFSVDVDALKNDDAAIVLANPNAPTGRALTRDDIASLVAIQTVIGWCVSMRPTLVLAQRLQCLWLRTTTTSL